MPPSPLEDVKPLIATHGVVMSPASTRLQIKYASLHQEWYKILENWFYESNPRILILNYLDKNESRWFPNCKWNGYVGKIDDYMFIF